jgi:hypothetical protein
MDMNEALVAAMGRMQSKMQKQRTAVRDLEQKLTQCRHDNAVLHTMVADRGRAIDQYRGTLEGLRAEVREFSDNNAKQAGHIARLEQETKQERGRAKDAERELRGLETKLNSAHMILRDMAVLIIAYSEGHTWDDDAKDMVNQYSTCDWMQKAHKDFERCTADGITPALRDVPEPKLGEVNPGESAIFSELAVGDHFIYSGSIWMKETDKFAGRPGTGTTMMLGHDVGVWKLRPTIYIPPGSLPPIPDMQMQLVNVHEALENTMNGLRADMNKRLDTVAMNERHTRSMLLAHGERLKDLEDVAHTPELKPSFVVEPGEHIGGVLPTTEGRPFGRNEHEAEEYVPPKVPIAGLMERVATLEMRADASQRRVDEIYQLMQRGHVCDEPGCRNLAFNHPNCLQHD